MYVLQHTALEQNVFQYGSQFLLCQIDNLPSFGLLDIKEYEPARDVSTNVGGDDDETCWRIVGFSLRGFVVIDLMMDDGVIVIVVDCLPDHRVHYRPSSWGYGIER